MGENFGFIFGKDPCLQIYAMCNRHCRLGLDERGLRARTNNRQAAPSAYTFRANLPSLKKVVKTASKQAVCAC